MTQLSRATTASSNVLEKVSTARLATGRSTPITSVSFSSIYGASYSQQRQSTRLSNGLCSTTSGRTGGVKKTKKTDHFLVIAQKQTKPQTGSRLWSEEKLLQRSNNVCQSAAAARPTRFASRRHHRARHGNKGRRAARRPRLRLAVGRRLHLWHQRCLPGRRRHPFALLPATASRQRELRSRAAVSMADRPAPV